MSSSNDVGAEALEYRAEWHSNVASDRQAVGIFMFSKLADRLSCDTRLKEGFHRVNGISVF